MRVTLLVLLALAPAAPAVAQADRWPVEGPPDHTALVGASDEANAVALQPDGKIVVAGLGPERCRRRVRAGEV